MSGDPAVREGIRLIRARDWYEAHEVLEIPWRAAPPGEQKRFLQGLIQLAVSLEHLRRGNPRGALGQWRKGRAKMEGPDPWFGGVGVAGWVTALEAFYASIDLPARSRAYLAGAQAAPGLPAAETWPLPAVEAGMLTR